MKIVLTVNPVERVFSQCAVCFFLEDIRPLRGGVGKVDWAMNGKISRLVREKKVTGAFMESALIRPGRMLACEKLLIVGMGPTAACTSDIILKLGQKLFQTLVNLRVKDISLSLSLGWEEMRIETFAENLMMGYLAEIHPNTPQGWTDEMALAISCDVDEIDEILLGIQKAKVALKRHFTVIVMES